MKNSIFMFVVILSSMFVGAAIGVAMRPMPKPLPPSPAEYLMTVTDDSVTIYDRQMDCERVVGTVKLEGQLDSLITLDNQ